MWSLHPQTQWQRNQISGPWRQEAEHWAEVERWLHPPQPLQETEGEKNLIPYKECNYRHSYRKVIYRLLQTALARCTHVESTQNNRLVRADG